MPGSVVHHFAAIGDWVIVNTNAHVDHENQIGNGVHIMGAAALSGQVIVEDYVAIGTNATILPGLRLGAGGFIGAGAVVTRDTEPDGVYVGVPARITQRRAHRFDADVLRRI
jgi:acetyltransferase-like isoleucine patch superfamily enzyme